MGKIYKSDGKYFKRLKPPGHDRRFGYHHYALWRPVRLVVLPIIHIKFYFPILSKQDFLLDMQGFEEV